MRDCHPLDPCEIGNNFAGMKRENDAIVQHAFDARRRADDHAPKRYRGRLVHDDFGWAKVPIDPPLEGWTREMIDPAARISDRRIKAASPGQVPTSGVLF